MNREVPMPAANRTAHSHRVERQCRGLPGLLQELDKKPLRFRLTLFDAFMQGQAAEDPSSALCAVADRAEEFDAVVIIRGGGSSDLNCFNATASAPTWRSSRCRTDGHRARQDTSVADMVAHGAQNPDGGGRMARRTDGRNRRMARQRRPCNSDTTAAAMRTPRRCVSTPFGRAAAAEAASFSPAVAAAGTPRRGASRRRGISSRGRRRGWKTPRADRRAFARTILRLGFAVVRSGGRAVTSVRAVAAGEPIEVEVADGKISATVNAEKIWQKKS